MANICVLVSAYVLCMYVTFVLDTTLCLDVYFPYSSLRKLSGTIDVIGGQTATISRVEGRRRHNLDGNNIQVVRSNMDAFNEHCEGRCALEPFETICQ